jgi:hypothetical protein
MQESAKGRIGWFALAVVLLLAGGGAARQPDALRVGSPGLLVIVLVAVVAIALCVRLPREGAALAGLLIVPILLLLVPRTAGAGALTGPPLLAIALAGLFAITADAGRLRHVFVPMVAALYLLVSARVQKQVGPQGDEPHYLMVADSLLRDGDVSLEADYHEGRYKAFFKEGLLEPHFRVRGKHGEIYSLHALGLSLLVLPAYAAFGYAGASFFMALLATLTVVLIRSLLRETMGPLVAERVAWLVALSPPLIHYAGLVFTEVPAALLGAFVLREGLRAREATVGRALAAGAAIAFLPWLNVRYAVVAAVLGLYWVAARPAVRSWCAFAVPGIVSLAALGAYHYALYGFFDPRRVYGRQPELALATIKDGVPGLFLDQEFGMLAYAPVFILAIPGLVWLIRSRPRLGIASAVLVAAVVVTAGSWPMWRGGFGPPARFLVPVVPAMALGVGAWIGDRRWAGAALLAGWSVFTGLAGGIEPRLVHRDRDVTAPLFRERSGATEWTRLLPSYVLGEPDRHALALLWALALAAAAVRWRGRPGAASLATAVVVLGAVAETASHISDGRSGGREATRVMGRPSVDWPSLQSGTSAARWTTSDLQWGPVYEPYRHSGSALVAERLPLPTGRYTLRIGGEALGDGSAASSLLLVGRFGRPLGRADCFFDPGVLRCPFVVPPATPEVSLALVGGNALSVKDIWLSSDSSTFPGDKGLIPMEGSGG